jgi:hypothetical protein
MRSAPARRMRGAECSSAPASRPVRPQPDGHESHTQLRQWAGRGDDIVLDLLRDWGIRSTFFVVGEHLRLPDARSSVERAAREGHWIGNYTMTDSIQFGRQQPPTCSNE